jgi:hypothetical protein
MTIKTGYVYGTWQGGGGESFHSLPNLGYFVAIVSEEYGFESQSWVTTLLLLEVYKLYEGTTFVVKWSEFLAADPEVPGSILGTTRFSE